MPVNNLIQLRRGSDWSTNPVLSSGEPGFDIPNNQLKIGDGSTVWSGLTPVNYNLNNYSITGVGNIDISGNITANSGIFDQIVFNTGLDDPNLTAGQLQWNSTEGTLDLGLNDNYAMHLGEEMLYRVRNITGSTLLAGQPVYASGLSPGGNNRIEVNLYVADGSIREVQFMGLVTEDITDNGNNGYATHFGYIRGIDTRGDAATYGTTDKLWAAGEPAWNEGDILYVHPTVAGKLTKIEPKHSISVAIITSKGSNGKIFVRPTSYGHLDDNHDVAVSGATNGQFLQYNSATDYWVPSSSGNFSTLLVNGTGVSLVGHTHVSGDLPADVVYLNANQTLTNKTLDAPDIIDGVFSDTFTIGSQVFYEQSTNGFSVNEDFDPSNSSTQTAYHFTTGPGRETLAFTLARTSQFTDGFGIYGTSADNTFVTFGEQSNTKFEWRRGVGIRPLDLDGGTLLMGLDTGGHLNVSGSGIFGSGIDVNGVADFSSTIDAPNLGAGEDNSVVILDSDGKLRTDEIDSRVWGSSLVDGNGTANYVAKWSDSNTLTSGIIYDNGTSVGIGTSSPSYTLDVAGTGHFDAVNINGAFTFPTSDGSPDQYLKTDGAGNVSWDSVNGGGVTINNYADNRVLTSDGTSTGINAETKLVFIPDPSGNKLGIGTTNPNGNLSMSNGSFGVDGDSQHTFLTARIATTNNVTATLFLDGSSTKIVLPPKCVWNFCIKLNCYSDTNGGAASWNFRGCIKRSDSTTSIVGSIIEENFIDTNLDGVTATIVANADTNSLDINVNGLDSNNIRWTASLDATQTRYDINNYVYFLPMMYDMVP